MQGLNFIGNYKMWRGRHRAEFSILFTADGGHAQRNGVHNPRF